MGATEPPRGLRMDQEEYRRRQEFCEVIKTFRRSEMIEIARILRKHNITLSENRSGMFFDMVQVPAPVFDELLKFHEFVQQNNVELSKRDDEARRAKELVHTHT